MKTVVILTMHGVPPRDYPRERLAELFGLRSRLEHGAADAQSAHGALDRPALERRLDELEEAVRRWPRTERNDPFHASSLEIGERLARTLGLEVIVAFNEFCAPGVEEAVDAAAAAGAARIVVATAMTTAGGEHAEVDIPAAIERCRERHPAVQLVYAWPFDTERVAGFLADQIKRFI